MMSKFGNWHGGDEPSAEGQASDADQASNVVSFPSKPRRARMPEPSSIPPRPWLYGNYLLRGFVSVLVAAGGVGKSMLAMNVAVACATSKPIMGHYVHARVNAWLFNLEDPLDEMDRRLAATMIRFQIDATELDGTLFMDSGRDIRLCMGMVGQDGSTILFPDERAIVDRCKENEIGLIVVDPFVKSHELDENRNGDMDAAITAWARVATQANCAVLLVHHVRKGTVIDIESARGGKALIDGARCGLTMAAMTPEESEKVGINPDDRHKYVRLDDGKANLAPKASRAKWFEISMINLGNGTPDYPNGDNVGTLVPWEPPSAFEAMDDLMCNHILDVVATGLPDGVLYSPSKRGRNNTRWVGNVIMKEMDCEEGQAARIVEIWLKNGLLEETTCLVNRHERAGVLVNNAKRPTGTIHV